MRKLKLAILLALTCLLPAQVVQALGLGDIEIFSALNQPLEAEIVLTSVRPGETDGMVVTLASEQAFLQAGVERPFYLTRLQFAVAFKPDGTPYIKITTKNPVREPFLSFLIDVDWPRGRLVREYTILLDPPVFASRHQKTPSVSSLEKAESVTQTTAVLELPDIAVSVDSEPALIERQTAIPKTSEVATLEDDTSATATVIDSEKEALESEEFLDFIDTENATTDAVDPSFPLEQKEVQDTVAESEVTTDKATVDPESLPDESVQTEDTQIVEDTIADVLLEDDPVKTADARMTPEELSADALPDIDITLDSSIPYDAENTERLLAEFAAEDSNTGARNRETVSQSDGIPVEPGDSLWEITSRILPEGVGMNQAMLAILRYNSDAFVRDNINNIKKGVVLRIPDKNSMLAIRSAEALAEVRRQNALWEEYRSQLVGYRATPDKTKADSSDTSGRVVASEQTGSTQLTILSPGRDSEASSRASGKQEGLDTGGAVYKELLLAQEALEAERLKKTELQSRLKELEGQVEMMQRIITLKDQKLAELQAKLKEVKPSVEFPATETGDGLESLQHVAATNPVSPVEADNDSATNPVTEETPQQEEKVLSSDVTANDAVLSTDTTTSLDIEDPLLADIDDPNALVIGTDKSAETVSDNSLNENTDAEVGESKSEIQATVQALPSPNQVKPKPIGIAGAIYDFLGYFPAPLSDILKSQLDTSYGIYLILAIPVLLLVLLGLLLRGKSAVKPVKKPIIGAHERGFEKTQDLKARDKLSLVQRILGLFKKKDKHSAASLSGGMYKDTNSEMFESTEPDNFDEINDDYLDDQKLFRGSDKDRSSSSNFDTEKTQIIKSAVQEAAEESLYEEPTTIEDSIEEEEEVLDDTTAEADVYLAYGLFDQAEELLKQALKQHPDRKEYLGKLLETYFSAGKKTEFVNTALELRGILGNKPGRLWEKAIAMGKEISPESELFKGADTGRYKASDFAVAKPEKTDIELGGGDAATKPDLDLGFSDNATDFGLGVNDRKSNTMHETIITPLDTISADDEAAALQETGNDLQFDLSEPDESELDIDLDFDAGDLGLDVTSITDKAMDTDEDESSVLEVDEEDEDLVTKVKNLSARTNSRAPEETVALDMDMELGGLDLGSIDDTDFNLGEEDQPYGEEDNEVDFNIGAEERLSDLDVDIDGEVELEFSTTDDEPEKTVVMAAAGDALLAEMDEAIDLSGSDDVALDDTIIEDEDEEDTFIDDENESFEIDGADEVNTKLDLAKAYIDMGDNDGASSTLEEVIAEGSEIQRKEAETLLRQIAR